MSWKKFTVIIAIALLAKAVGAQGPYATSEQVSAFSNTKLLVVMDGRDVAFDAMLKNAIEKHWQINDYELINSDRFNEAKTNPEYSFLITLQTEFDNDPHGHTYNFMYLMLSHPTGDIQEMPVIARIPFVGSTLTSSNELHKTEMLVKFIQSYATDVVKSEGSKRLHKLNHLNKRIKDLKGKALYFSESQVAFSMAEGKDFGKIYKNYHRVVTNEELVDIVKKAEKDVVVFHIVAPGPDATSGKCFKMIIEPATGKGYFYKTQSISEKKPPLILKRDFRNIRWYPIHWL